MCFGFAGIRGTVHCVSDGGNTGHWAKVIHWVDHSNRRLMAGLALPGAGAHRPGARGNNGEVDSRQWVVDSKKAIHE